MNFTQLKNAVAKRNRTLADLAKYKLDAGDAKKYNVDSDLFLQSGHISLLEFRQVLFWIQGSQYKHTTPHEQTKQILSRVANFSAAYGQLDRHINAMLDELRAKQKQDGFQEDPSDEWQKKFSALETEYEACAVARQTLIDAAMQLKRVAAAEPEQYASNPEKPAGNEAPIELLFAHFKDYLQAQIANGVRFSAGSHTKPELLLHQFIYAVLDDHDARFSPEVKTQVSAIVTDLGGRVMVPEAFNVDSGKKHGVLKSANGIRLLKDVANYLAAHLLDHAATGVTTATKERLQNLIGTTDEAGQTATEHDKPKSL